MTPHQEKLIIENMKMVPFVFNKYYKRFLHTQVHEDIMSLGYIGLVRAAKSYDGQYRFTTWAAYHIRNEINRYFRSLHFAKRQATVVSLDEPLESKGREREMEIHEVIPAPRDSELTRIEYQDLVDDLLDFLPERERLIIQMYFWGEMSMEEIGEMLGITRQRVHQIFAQALRRMRRRLQKMGYRKADLKNLIA